jgi:hypothetical protein
VAAQPSGKAAPDLPSYFHPAEVADILHLSPKTVSRWACGWLGQEKARTPWLVDPDGCCLTAGRSGDH